MCIVSRLSSILILLLALGSVAVEAGAKEGAKRKPAELELETREVLCEYEYYIR